MYHCTQEATEELVKKKIRDPSDFEWLKQSRFHWRADRDTVVTSICDVDFEYSYEYLGATQGDLYAAYCTSRHDRANGPFHVDPR